MRASGGRRARARRRARPRSRRPRCRAPARAAGSARCRPRRRSRRPRGPSGRRSAPATLDSPSTASSRSRATPLSRTAASSLRSARGGERAAGELGQRPRRVRSSTSSAGREGEDRLAERAGVDGQLRRRPRGSGGWRRGGRRGGRRPRWRRASRRRARPRRCASASRSAWTMRAPAQLVEVEVGVAELQQAGAELVLVGVAVLLDEAVRLQRLQQAVDGRAGEPSRSASSLTPSRRGPAASALRMRAARSTDWIVPRLGGRLAIRHCRIGFDSVD